MLREQRERGSGRRRRREEGALRGGGDIVEREEDQGGDLGGGRRRVCLERPYRLRAPRRFRPQSNLQVKIAFLGFLVSVLFVVFFDAQETMLVNMFSRGMVLLDV